jgi:hypothetical protein
MALPQTHESVARFHYRYPIRIPFFLAGRSFFLGERVPESPLVSGTALTDKEPAGCPFLR